MNAPAQLVVLPVAIGLSGFAQTGKTTAANYLEERFGYTRLHIAEPLRDMIRTLMFHFNVPADMIERYLTGDLKESVIPEIGATSRWLQISLGTEWGREQVDPDIWANAWRIAADAAQWPMNDSVRFPNEESSVRARDGKTILIRRKGAGPAAFKWRFIGKLLYRLFGVMWGVHDSERVDRLKPDYIIDNDGTVEELYDAIDRIMDLRRASNH